MFHHDRLFATRQTATTSFLGPVSNSERGRFLLPPPPSMEPAANRTQADAFHASLQAFLENVLVPDCILLWDRTIKLNSVMRHRSSCRRRTKSTVHYDYDYEEIYMIKKAPHKHHHVPGQRLCENRGAWTCCPSHETTDHTQHGHRCRHLQKLT